MSKTPLLILSDMPTSSTGLGRITRELADRIAGNMSDIFRVAVCGYGGTNSRHLRYMKYPVTRLNDWSMPQLPEVWQDFAGDEKGIVLAIWNASWLPWLVNPTGEMKRFLDTKPFKKWLYAPIDAEGPNGRLPKSQGDIFKGFDRVLAYTRFGARLMEQAMDEPVEHLPHGIDTTTFQPIHRTEARARFLPAVLAQPGRITDDVFLLSAVATNTPRKDWGLCFEACGELLHRGEHIGLWVHTDAVQRQGAWDLAMLADEFGMKERVIFSTGKLTDEEMAIGYNACDVALSIGSGEGWGYTAAEALACGIPCIHGAYAGSTEFIPEEFLVEPAGFRIDGYYGNRRPVFKAEDWANAIMFHRGKKAELAESFSWHGCWPAWEQWLREGLK